MQKVGHLKIKHEYKNKFLTVLPVIDKSFTFVSNDLIF